MEGAILSGSAARRDVALYGLAAAGGAMLPILQRLAQKGPVTIDRPGFPEWLRLYDSIVAVISAWPWNLVLAFALILWLIQARFKKGAWVLAFGIGVLLGTIAADKL